MPKYISDLNELSTITDDDLMLVRDSGGAVDYKVLMSTLKEYMRNGVLDYVTYEQFGADLTGITPSDSQIKACHDFANANNLKVKQNYGTVYWQSQEIEVKTDVDLSGLTVRMDVNSGTTALTYSQPVMYKIVSKENPINLDSITIADLNSTYSDYFKSKSMRLPNAVFGEYNGRMVKIIGTEVDVYRSGNPASFFNKQESVTLGRRGQIEQPLYKDYQGTIDSVTIYPREDFQLEFKCPKLDLDGVASFCFIRCERSNTKITGLVITEGSTWPSNVREVVQALDVHDIVLEDWDCLAMPIGSTNAGGVYCFTGAHIVRLRANRLRGNTGWGFTGCNFLKDVSFTNNAINRIDCHWGAYDVYLSNNRIINFGCLLAGGGTFSARDNDYCITGPLDSPIGESIVRAFFECRPDYGAEWDGDILIDGLKYVIDPGYISSFGTNTFDIVRMVPSPSNVDFSRAMYHGRNVVIKNVFLDMDSTQQNDTLDTTLTLQALNYGSVAVGAQNQYYPHTITVENISTTLSPENFWVVAYIPPNYMHPTTRALYEASDLGSLEFNQKVTIRDIHCGDRSYKNALATRGLVKFNLDWALTSSTYAAYLTDPLAIRPKIYVDNCDVAVMGICMLGIVDINNSVVGQLFTRSNRVGPIYGPNSSQLKVTMSNSTLRLVSTATGADTFELPDEVLMFNCGLSDLVNRDGTYAASGSGSKLKGSGNRVIATTTEWGGFNYGFLYTDFQEEYQGRIASDGTPAYLPDGWSCSKTAPGTYLITHNLGVTSYDVIPSAVSSVFRLAFVTNYSSNTFTVKINDGTFSDIDAAFAFHLKVRP